MQKKYTDPRLCDMLLVKWMSMLGNAKAEIRIYGVESARAIITVLSHHSVDLLQRFLSEQPDVDYWEQHGQRFYPGKKGQKHATGSRRAQPSDC
ncbi:ldl receptor wingless signaling trafficking chaperone [Cystoisospora suis]|uniref:Ldl receptor wingless signaling trafficking chaperone n=1 Tax=Cystoisospora suis TaxID=483139 RepID=A0A2C6KX77_9APIC|nr:ldl receptor wingless signaling trafficking chaperone [Cystoisospora suis]